ncbi:hypothetical protein HID58_006582 [Brassica napus]|uniref:DNA polymerase alpha/delta/epsilon subunit B domain-containing protein n=1 Tax=Brassica napus TaxID=3708 RepID=A0ABQ8EBS7_BRANA|nr:hypothetical protein HID58_006582 [Brassica napus]
MDLLTPIQSEKINFLNDELYQWVLSGFYDRYWLISAQHVLQRLVNSESLNFCFVCRLFKIHAGVSEAIISSVNDPPPITCLFPRSTLYNTFRSCRNPHSFDVDNIRFLGTYGKNINDLDKYSEAKSNLDFFERTLKWSHLAPTAPNTLSCYPFTDCDLFMIATCPHVFFIGSQDKYDNRSGQKVSREG